MTVRELQDQTNEWIMDHGVRYFDEMTNTVILMEEVGEFARLMARVYGQQTFKQPVNASDYPAMLADEMADILFVLTCLANQLDIDLTRAIHTNMIKKTTRDSERHRDNKKLRD